MLWLERVSRLFVNQLVINEAILVMGHQVRDSIGMVGTGSAEAIVLDVVVDCSIIHKATALKPRDKRQVIEVLLVLIIANMIPLILSNSFWVKGLSKHSFGR